MRVWCRWHLTVSENRWYESRCIPYFINETIWNPFKLPFSSSCLSQFDQFEMKKSHFSAPQCPPLPEVEYATAEVLAGSGLKYGAVMRCECDPGYKRTGMSVLICQSNGVPTCSRESGARFWVQTSTASKSSHEAPKKDRTTMDIPECLFRGMFYLIW